MEVIQQNHYQEERMKQERERELLRKEERQEREEEQGSEERKRKEEKNKEEEEKEKKEKKKEEERKEREANEEKLLAPFVYLRQNPGKNIRGKLLDAFNLWLKIDKEKLALINDVVDMLHTGSLLIDDIEDDSLLRRGKPVAHLVYGLANTINCGNYVYFLALQKLINEGRPELVKIYSEELCNLHRGQGCDIIWRESGECPSLNAYEEMISNKTGGLLRLALKLMQVYSDNKSDFIPLMDLLGKHFQIRDDYVNLRSEEFMKGKGFCEDISEGKFSFPIIHSLRSSSSSSSSSSSLSSSSSSTTLLSLMKLRSKDPEILRQALSLIDQSGSFEFTITYLFGLEEKMFGEIKRLGGNKYLEAIVAELAKVYHNDVSLAKITL